MWNDVHRIGMRQSYTLSELHMKKCILPGRQKCSNTIPDSLPPKLPECRYISRWWQLKYVLFPPRIPGEDEPILTNIFQLGWFNHQLDMLYHWGSGWPGMEIFFLQKSPQLGGMRVMVIPGSSFRGSWEWMVTVKGAESHTMFLRVSTQHPFTGRCWDGFSTGDFFQ